MKYLKTFEQKLHENIKITSDEIIVTGIARINVPKTPPTNSNGAKLSAAVAVAATIARDTRRVASLTVLLRSLL